MNNVELQQYLSRIGVTRSDQCSYDFLSAIQQNHLLNINFDNLYLIANKQNRWNWNEAFESIVKQKGGGVCFEINYLLHQLLRALKFDVIFVAAPHVLTRGDTIVDHVANLVTIDGQKYLVDVADGYFSSRKPIQIYGQIVEDVNFVYRVINEANLFTLQIQRNDDWKSRYTFTEDDKCIEDFKDEFTNSAVEQFLRETIYLVNTSENEKWLVFDKRLSHFVGREMHSNDIDEQYLKYTIRNHFDIADKLIPSHFPTSISN